MKDKILSPWTSNVEVSSHEDLAVEFCCVGSNFFNEVVGVR